MTPKAERETRVLVQLPDGQRFWLHDAPAAVVAFVAAVASELSAAEYATLTFEVNKGDVKPSLERRWGAIKRDAPGALS